MHCACDLMLTNWAVNCVCEPPTVFASMQPTKESNDNSNCPFPSTHFRTFIFFFRSLLPKETHVGLVRIDYSMLQNSEPSFPLLSVHGPSLFSITETPLIFSFFNLHDHHLTLHSSIFFFQHHLHLLIFYLSW